MSPQGNNSERGLVAMSMSKRFGNTYAVRDVSIELRPGRVLGIIGPNGSGKTTLFNVISGTLRATAGRVYLHGEDVSRLRLSALARRGLGRTFQQSMVFSQLTVRQNFANALLRTRQEKATGREASDAVEAYGFEAVAGRYAGELSYGDQRRLGLALALSRKPGVLLLDEPGSGLSHEEAEEVGRLVRLARSMDVAVGLIDHNIGLLVPSSDEIVALDQGRVIFSGLPEDALKSPEVVRSYFGSLGA